MAKINKVDFDAKVNTDIPISTTAGKAASGKTVKVTNVNFWGDTDELTIDDTPVVQDGQNVYRIYEGDKPMGWTTEDGYNALVGDDKSSSSVEFFKDNDGNIYEHLGRDRYIKRDSNGNIVERGMSKADVIKSINPNAYSNNNSNTSTVSKEGFEKWQKEHSFENYMENRKHDNSQSIEATSVNSNSQVDSPFVLPTDNNSQTSSVYEFELPEQGASNNNSNSSSFIDEAISNVVDYVANDVIGVNDLGDGLEINEASSNSISDPSTEQESTTDESVVNSFTNINSVEQINNNELIRNFDGSNLDLINEQKEKYGARYGIDVSYSQGDIDWSKVAASGVDFANIRAVRRRWGDGELDFDTKARDNVINAIDNGLDVGLYCYSVPLNEKEAEEEAQMMIDFIESLPEEYRDKITMPLINDYETSHYKDGQSTRLNGQTTEQRVKNIEAFNKYLNDRGYKTMTYSYESYLKNELGGYDFSNENNSVWVANFSNNSSYSNPYNMFQYSETGHVDGITQNAVDLNVYYPGNISNNNTQAVVTPMTGDSPGGVLLDEDNNSNDSKIDSVTDQVADMEPSVIEHVEDSYGMANIENVPTEADAVPDNGGNNAVPYFSQGSNRITGTRPDWADIRFGDDNIAGSGCSITSFAMVASYYGIGTENANGYVYPDDVLQKIIDIDGDRNYGYTYGAGPTQGEIFPRLADHYNLNVEQLSSQSALQSLQEGKPLVVRRPGHFFVLSGVTEDGKVVVNDPANRSKSDVAYTLDEWISREGITDFWQFTPTNQS